MASYRDYEAEEREAKYIKETYEDRGYSLQHPPSKAVVCTACSCYILDMEVHDEACVAKK